MGSYTQGILSVEAITVSLYICNNINLGGVISLFFRMFIY